MTNKSLYNIYRLLILGGTAISMTLIIVINISIFHPILLTFSGFVCVGIGWLGCWAMSSIEDLRE